MARASPWRSHWPEYAIEAAGVSCFVASALCFSVLFRHPGSPVAAFASSPLERRALLGVAMGATLIALIYSPWGQRSGAHFNPSLTLTFFRLGKVAGADALGYGLAQFGGALLGALGAALLLGPWLADPDVRYGATLPGVFGVGAAFAAEVAISFGLMLAVLLASNHPPTHRFTGLFAGCLVALYVTFESPVSGTSMNPARSLSAASVGGLFSSLWIYFTAPPLGMLLAAELFVRLRGVADVRCAKLHHQNAQRCIFHCGYREPKC